MKNGSEDWLSGPQRNKKKKRVTAKPQEEPRMQRQAGTNLEERWLKVASSSEGHVLSLAGAIKRGRLGRRKEESDA